MLVDELYADASLQLIPWLVEVLVSIHQQLAAPDGDESLAARVRVQTTLQRLVLRLALLLVMVLPVLRDYLLEQAGSLLRGMQPVAQLKTGRWDVKQEGSWAV